MSIVKPRGAMSHVFLNSGIHIQGVVFLSVVAKLEAMAIFNDSAIGFFNAGK